ncbi:MAG TPA: DUF1330 domain-containing protein [Pseudolabrys sp.]|nr:DUF1330 domain-containing protein [Pseudolabrys sp.]
MKIRHIVALSLMSGAALGAGVVETLHAQAKPQAYVVGEIDITDAEGYAKEFGPLARKALAEGPGYRALVLGGKSIAIAGAPPKKRVIINVFDNLDAAVAAYSSPAFKEAKKIGDKYATFRTFAVEGR